MSTPIAGNSPNPVSPATTEWIERRFGGKVSDLSLRDRFFSDPEVAKLPKERAEKVFALCMAEYHKSVVEYERIAASVAFHHPGAQEFSKRLCQRISSVIDAFNEIMEEENPSAHSKELMRAMRMIQILGNDPIYSGSVGTNFFTIEEVIKNGNLREQMTLVYNAIFSFLTVQILSNPEMIKKINKKLEKLPADKRFQIDKALCEKEMREKTGIITLSKKAIIDDLTEAPGEENSVAVKTLRESIVIKAIEEVQQFRDAGGRLSRPRNSSPMGEKIEDIPGFSRREALAESSYADLHVEPDKLPKDKRLRWVAGKQCYSVAPDSPFARQAERLGGLPALNGPSGTTDAFLHVARYLGLDDKMQEGALACAGWMIPAQDHSLHEVRISANRYGVNYAGGVPEDFANFYSKDPGVRRDIDAELQKRGLRNPSYYFSPEFLHSALHSLDPLASVQLSPSNEAGRLQLHITPALVAQPEKPAESDKTELDQELENITRSVVVADHKNLDETPATKERIRVFNLELRQIEASYLYLMRLQARDINSVEITRKMRYLTDRYQAKLLEKVAFVKHNVKPKNKVYAMSIPRTLSRGTFLSASGSFPELTEILFGGFSKFENYSSKATSPQPKDPKKELGEMGHYFSIGYPHYLSPQDECALSCCLEEEQNGTAIMTISELSSFGFKPDEIEIGYKRLQSEYPFIQSDGLFPKERGLVLLNPEKSKYSSFEFHTGEGERISHCEMQRFVREKMQLNEKDLTPEIHSSWINGITQRPLRADPDGVAAPIFDPKLVQMRTGADSIPTTAAPPPLVPPLQADQ